MNIIGWIALAFAALWIVALLVRVKHERANKERYKEIANEKLDQIHDLKRALEGWRERAWDAEKRYQVLAAKDALNVEEETYLQESYGLPERPEL